MKFTKNAEKALNDAWRVASDNHHQFVMPEHLLFALLGQPLFLEALECFTENTKTLHNKLLEYLNSLERMPETTGSENSISLSGQMEQLIVNAQAQVDSSSAEMVDVPHLVSSMFSPGKGNGNPVQYSCLGNPMDRGAWWATVHGVPKESDMT